MLDNEEKKSKSKSENLKIWGIYLTILVIIGGAVLAGIFLDRVLKRTPDGGVEINTRKVEALKSFLGAELLELNEVIKRQLDISADQGALINSVIAGSPAADAGMQPGDVIIRFDRQRVRDVAHLQALIAETSPGDRIKVAVERDNNTRVFYVKLGESPAAASIAALTQTQPPPMASLGMTAVPTGNPNESDDEGYKGMPPVIPPKGEYDPETMGPRTAAITQNRVEVCICPLCGATVTHPPGIPCSQMECPVCGSRLMNASPGIATAFDDTRTPNQGDPQRPSYAGAAKGQRDLDAVSLSGIQTGGGGSEEEDDDKGRKPSSIPPVGSPGEAANVINIWQIGGQPVSNQPSDIPPSVGKPTAGGQTAAAQTTAGTVNRVQLCICPVCGTTVGHPAGIPCSDLNCPDCGSRLIPANPGANSSTSQQGNRPPTTGQGMAQGGIGGSSGSGSSGSGGPGGECVCPNCGTIVPHTASVPCYEINCPRCGTLMLRAIPGVTISEKPETIPPTDKGQMAVTTSGNISQKIAIASEGKNLNSKIASLFDRSPYFIIVGLGAFQAYKNPNANDSRDVGVQSAQFVVDKGASAVITDNISLEAMKELRRLNVRVYSGVSRTVSQALECYTDGHLDETSVGTDKSDSGSHDESEGKSKEKKGRDAERVNVVL